MTLDVRQFFFWVFAASLCSSPEIVVATISPPKEQMVDSAPATSSDELPPELKAAEIRENLGAQLGIDKWVFTNEEGASVTLSQLTGQKPSIVVMAYYNCPALCGALLNGVNNSLRAIKWSIGQDFNLVVVSIDPREKSELAAQKKANFVKAYGRLGADVGAHFLVGQETEVKGLANELGFHYYYDADIQEYAHSAGIFFVAPSGILSRVLFGIDFPAQDLKLALMEASEGRVGSVLERFMMFCYKYDPARKGYALAAMRVVQLGGLVTLGFGGLYLFFFWRRERKRNVERRKAA